MRKWILGTGVVFVLGLIGVMAAQYVLVVAPQRAEMHAMEVRMDELDAYMKSKGAVEWEPRQYLFDSIIQAWYVPDGMDEAPMQGFEIITKPAESGYYIVEAKLTR